MKTKSLALLAVAAIGTIALAVFSLNRNQESVTTAHSPETTSKDAKDRLFPGLLEKINDVATVTIKEKDSEYTLSKANGAWGLADKANYPIEVESVRKLLISMGEMRKLEPKTADPANYGVFGVQDPGTTGAESALVTLKDSSGAEMAKLVYGKEHESKGAALSNQRYVRRGGEAQTWLVQGTFDLKEKGSDLLQKKILEVKRDRIRSVEITQPDGSLLAIDRASPTLTDFTLLAIPEGKELTYPTAPGSVASGLEYVNLDDVAPAGGIDYSAPPGPVAKFKTFDGLVVTVTTQDKDGKAWAKFVATYEEPHAEPTPEGETPKADPKKKTPEEVQAEVAALNERLAPWDFQISSYTRSNFGKKMSELLKDKPAPVDPNDPNKDAYVIPSTLPPEIQEQIKADQEAKGNKVIIRDPAPAATPATDGAEPKTDEPTPDHDHSAPDHQPH